MTEEAQQKSPLSKSERITPEERAAAYRALSIALELRGAAMALGKGAIVAEFDAAIADAQRILQSPAAP